MQLEMQWLPQCLAEGTMRRFVVSVPWERSELPQIVQHYMASSWRPETMPLAEFTRKANKDGQIQRYLKKRYEAAKAEAEEEIEESLAEWAAQAPTYGEVLTAAIYLSRRPWTISGRSLGP